MPSPHDAHDRNPGALLDGVTSGRSERLLGQHRRSLARSGEQITLDGHEPGHVAHVAVELRDDDRALALELCAEAPQAGGVALGERAQVRQCLHRPGGQATVAAEVGGESGLVDRVVGFVPGRAGD